MCKHIWSPEWASHRGIGSTYITRCANCLSIKVSFQYAKKQDGIWIEVFTKEQVIKDPRGEEKL